MALQHIVLAQQHLLEGPAPAEVQEGAPTCGSRDLSELLNFIHQALPSVQIQSCSQGSPCRPPDSIGQHLKLGGLWRSRQCTQSSPTEPLPAEADGCAELLLALSGGGIIKSQLFVCRNVSQGVDCDGQPPSAGHDHRLAVGIAAVAHAAGQCALQIHTSGSLCMCRVQHMQASPLLICTMLLFTPCKARCGTSVVSQLCHCYASVECKPATWVDSRAPELAFWAASMNRTS